MHRALGENTHFGRDISHPYRSKFYMGAFLFRPAPLSYGEGPIVRSKQADSEVKTGR